MSASDNPVSSIVQEENTLKVKVPVETGRLTHTFRIEGQVNPQNDYEVTEHQDNSVNVNDGTVTAVNIIGGPNGVDTFKYRGKILDATVPDQAEVYLNGHKVSVQDLLNYYERQSGGGKAPGSGNQSGFDWTNPWFLVSVTGVGISALGVAQRTMQNRDKGGDDGNYRNSQR